MCLLVVLLTARAVVVAGRGVTLSMWSPFAYLWQDMLVAALFVGVDARVKRPRLAWTSYGALVLYVALNVPVTRVLSTPLTSTILRAARGPLADAVLHYVTVVNLVALALPLAVGAALPRLLKGRVTRITPGAAMAALVVVAIGPVATSRVDTEGLHRNALGALIETSVTRVAAKNGSDDWRATEKHGITPNESNADLMSLRGSMRARNVVLVALESTG
ncbi:MAG: hypothetical protein JF613_04665, partial [Acidobacteria bacterium]|nr:hypothetical protein [Acidobacteriota bacterium]